MTQPHWPTKMIARIEALREMVPDVWVDRSETSIRLIPDALGTIDVSLKREGDTVQVQMKAEQPQTRQLLADAAPKLTELAEQRGLKLHQAGADASSGGSAFGGQAAGSRRPTASRPSNSSPPAPRRAAPRRRHPSPTTTTASPDPLP
ncbi:flagellar hook-length control protein FliK [Sphingomonas sp. MMS24-JH45]